jgi:hypothetical protein
VQSLPMTVIPENLSPLQISDFIQKLSTNNEHTTKGIKNGWTVVTDLFDYVIEMKKIFN